MLAILSDNGGLTQVGLANMQPQFACRFHPERILAEIPEEEKPGYKVPWERGIAFEEYSPDGPEIKAYRLVGESFETFTLKLKKVKENPPGSEA